MYALDTVRRLIAVPIMAIAGVAIVAAGCSSGAEAPAPQTTAPQASASSSEDYEALAAQFETLEARVDELAGLLATPTPVSVLTYSDYGFSIPIPESVEVRTAGLTTDSPSSEAGTLAASAGGTAVLLLWSSDGLNSSEAVQSAFDVLQQATPNMDYVVSSVGDLSVDGEDGDFGSFAALSADNELLGIGLIGGWVCGSTGRTYALTVTGAERTPVQSSFARLTDEFKCA